MPQQKFDAMKKTFFTCLTVCLTLLSCSKNGVEGVRFSEDSSQLSHGMIVLGERLNNPYTVENVRDAYTGVYPTRSSSDIQTTHLYVRFLPKTEADFRTLEAYGVSMLDHPMDYRIVQDGDYYHDPQLPQEQITWQYAVVDKAFHFPSGVYYEVIDECCLTENLSYTRAMEGVDWAAVEKEAYRISGNEQMYEACFTKAGEVQPTGRITICDPDYLSGRPVGLSGVRIMTNIFVKFATTYTDRDGYYTIPKKYNGKPYYRVVFKNEKGFAIGFNWVLVPASVSTLGKNGPEGLDYCITRDSDYELFTRGIVNNAAYEYFNRCDKSDLDIALPPSNLRFWMFKHLNVSSAVMLQQGAFYYSTLIGQTLGEYTKLLELFSPDITIGTKDYGQPYHIYASVVHEMAHASHFSSVGTGYWDIYIKDILEGYVRSGFTDPYGNGTEENAGYCAVGEMWAYYLSSKLFEDRYHKGFATFGSGNWFYPQILASLGERGFSPNDIFSVLTEGVHDCEKLKNALIEKFPSRRQVVEQVFERYE